MKESTEWFSCTSERITHRNTNKRYTVYTHIHHKKKSIYNIYTRKLVLLFFLFPSLISPFQTHDKFLLVNAEFQRIARRDKKAFFGDQRKEIEENNRMGKTRDLFKKFRDTKGTFHANMGSINDRNGMDLTEAEDIKKR